MCGITGKIHFSTKKVEFAELKAMTDSIIHRGPDDVGHFLDNNIGLGFRRLSIIDIKLGHQPLSNSEESVWITFNGEIYNYKELRNDLIAKGYKFNTHSDTEVILNLYVEYGYKCLDYLRGMFGFVIFDKRTRQVFGARDRFGIKPLFYSVNQSEFIWGSEVKSITSSSNFQKEINKSAINEYFTYGYICNKNTIFTNISKLLPGHYFTLNIDDSNSFEEKKYWEPNFEPDYSVSEKEWEERIRDQLEESVKMRLMSEVPLGAFLSGGVDSSAVVALMSKFSETQVNTFSIGFKEERFNELKYAKLVSEKYNTKHHELIVEPESISLLSKLVKYYDEPFADASAMPTYYVSKFAREHVTVVLSGDGGDELFAGYTVFDSIMKHHNEKLNNKFLNHSSSLAHNLLPHFAKGKGLSYFYSKDKNHIGAYKCLWKMYEREKLFNKDFLRDLELQEAEKYKISILQDSNADHLNKNLELWMKTFLVDDILTKVDRASMMNSLEARVPILDHKFAELTFKIPSDLKLKGSEKKYIFKKALEPYLPDEVLKHKKQGFGVPLEIWFKSELKDYMYSVLGNRYSTLYNYLNFSYVQEILNQHIKGVKDYSFKIWSILFFDEWLKQNIDD